MGFFNASALRMILEHETEADAPISEETQSQIRENLEHLLLMVCGSSVTGTLSSDPPNDTTGVATDSSKSWSTDEHNGRSLLMTSGSAKGNYYAIDNTTGTTVVCSGDNLYADGVRSGDTYRIMYDLSNAQAHTHDDVNSAAVNPTVVGNYVLNSASIDVPDGTTGNDEMAHQYSGWASYTHYRGASLKISRSGALRIRLSAVNTSTTYTRYFGAFVTRNGSVVGSDLIVYLDPNGGSDSVTFDVSGWSVGDILDMYVLVDIPSQSREGTYTVEVAAANPMYDPAYLLESEL